MTLLHIMDNNGFIAIFISQARATPPLEWIAIFFAVAEVLLARSNKVLLYPAGIISTVIYTYLFIGIGLYADAILNTYYFVMSIYGWYLWVKRRGNGTHLPISANSRKDWLITAAIVVLGWGLLYVLLTKIFPLVFGHYYHISDVAVWDAFISAAAWSGMWLLAKRKIENWLLLNLSNAVAIPVLIYKDMPFTAALTLFLFIVAIFGYFEWRKLYHIRQAGGA
jgi:nicotinamide mononucleotide transporter